MSSSPSRATSKFSGSIGTPMGKKSDESGKAEELLKSAATNLAQLQSYPADEAAWLVTTSFNRGVAHHRMGRIEKAAHAFVISQELVCHAKKFDPTLVRLESRIREARAAVEHAPAAIQ